MVSFGMRDRIDFYCHILSVLLTGEIMAAFLIYRLIKEKGMELERWIALIKAGIVALILALPIIIPLITDFFGKELPERILVFESFNNSEQLQLIRLGTWQQAGASD